MISRGMAECHALGDDGRAKTRFEEEESTGASGFFEDTFPVRGDERRSQRTEAQVRNILVKSHEYRGVSKARGRHVGVEKRGDRRLKSKGDREK